jgi:hypothetical protein
MNDEKKAALLARFDEMSLEDQNIIAAKVQGYAPFNEYNVHSALPVDLDGEEYSKANCWAAVYIGAGTLRKSADYLEALAWFYLDTRPADAVARLVEAKLPLIGMGKRTDDFWKFLESL